MLWETFVWGERGIEGHEWAMSTSELRSKRGRGRGGGRRELLCMYRWVPQERVNYTMSDVLRQARDGAHHLEVCSRRCRRAFSGWSDERLQPAARAPLRVVRRVLVDHSPLEAREACGLGAHAVLAEDARVRDEQVDAEERLRAAVCREAIWVHEVPVLLLEEGDAWLCWGECCPWVGEVQSDARGGVDDWLPGQWNRTAFDADGTSLARGR